MKSFSTTGKKNIPSLEPPCRKAIYHTREDAEDMIRHLAETRTGREIRAYRCDVCGFWHLTSRGKPESLKDEVPAGGYRR